MSASAPPDTRRRWLRRLGIPLGCVLLTLAFAAWQFPWDQVNARLSRQLGEAIGANVRIDRLGPGLGLSGPWLVAHDATLSWPGEGTLQLSRLAVRPAWALSWLRGEPAVAVDLQSGAGILRGTIWMGAEPAFAGRITDLDPTTLPPRLLGNRFPPLTGLVGADVEVALSGARGVSGSLELDVTDGALSIPDTPVAIPFDRLQGAITVSEDGSASLVDGRLQGPLVSLGLKGNLGSGRDLSRSPLALDLDLEQVDPSFAPLLSNLGLRVGPGGGRFRIEGTLADPRIKAR